MPCHTSFLISDRRVYNYSSSIISQKQKFYLIIKTNESHQHMYNNIPTPSWFLNLKIVSLPTILFMGSNRSKDLKVLVHVLFQNWLRHRHFGISVVYDLTITIGFGWGRDSASRRSTRRWLIVMSTRELRFTHFDLPIAADPVPFCIIN